MKSKSQSYMFPHYVKLTNIWRKNCIKIGVSIVSWTGSIDESKEKAEQEPKTKDEQDNETFNDAQDDEEGNMSDEAERDEEGTGQQEQQEMQDMEEESANLDLPDDLQLDEEGNERNDGE